ncbi:MAG: bifunctional DNA-formamidopyrimidine glycosylase/DNA-(apurinic or apyrimidinic site) lyase [Nannocystaceae bacterium]|nr:bifunctional DNA-formamidopyrimidine glycosylase/DNA-(apurinic or apyrimidinic site) lyase [Nannocystaceae bacterium]
MPELPEVECVRRGLARADLSSKVISSIWRSELALRTGAFWRDERLHLLERARTGEFERRGKFLVWCLTSPENEALAAVIHLGMTGRVTVCEPRTERAPHTHLEIVVAGGPCLHYTDARRFGGVHVDTVVRLKAEGPLASLGPEPLSRAFNADVLRARGGRSKRVIREVLLDQRVVAGLGNIYVSEALHIAGVPPLAPAVELRPEAWDRMTAAIREVLRQALRNGGTTLRDYRGSKGERGRNQSALRAYGRAGEPCLTCGNPLHGYVHAGRSGVTCRSCQPARRRT